jgi:hypothetical protein
MTEDVVEVTELKNDNKCTFTSDIISYQIGAFHIVVNVLVEVQRAGTKRFVLIFANSSNIITEVVVEVTEMEEQ